MLDDLDFANSMAAITEKELQKNVQAASLARKLERDKHLREKDKQISANNWIKRGVFSSNT